MQQGPARLRCSRSPDVTLHGGTLRSQTSIKMDGVGGRGTRGAWDLQGESADWKASLTGGRDEVGRVWLCSRGARDVDQGLGVWGGCVCAATSCSRSSAVRLHTDARVRKFPRRSSSLRPRHSVKCQSEDQQRSVLAQSRAPCSLQTPQEK